MTTSRLHGRRGAVFGPVIPFLAGSKPEPLLLPTTRLPSVHWFNALLEQPLFKALLPVPILLALAPALWRLFRGTWRQLDRETLERRLLALRPARPRPLWGFRFARWRSKAPQPSGRWLAGALGRRRRRGTRSRVWTLSLDLLKDPTDYRPAACFVIAAVVLTIQEYYGGRHFFDTSVGPFLDQLEDHGWAWLKLKKYDELYGYAWWVMCRVVGYGVVPVLFWKLLFPSDSVLDMGLRGKGFLSHLWIYGACLAFVIPVMLIVAQQPDFGSYYPFYKNSSRSWFDFLAWEGMYWMQFFALEFFFRGWMISSLRRTFGAGAIFAMIVPYCMIHYGKPYLEAHGAIIAGIVLGSLAMRTRSIYAGFLLHITVACGMDLLSLYKRGVLPIVFWAAG